MEQRPAEARKVLLDSAFRLMGMVGRTASQLSRLPAGSGHPGVHAGLSFALDRHFAALELSSEHIVLVERLQEIAGAARASGEDALEPVAQELDRIVAMLSRTMLSPEESGP